MKACPFCASKNLIEVWSNFDAGVTSHVHCRVCGARGPEVYIEKDNKVHAIMKASEAWNLRKGPK